LEYSNIPSAILNVHKEHTTDTDVFATSTILLQLVTLHFNCLFDFCFFMFYIYVIDCPVGPWGGGGISSLFS